MTVDILVTFPHQSLQEFLGAFYFVLSLGKKQIVNRLNGAIGQYLKNPLFSEFCLWLLDESDNYKFLSSPEPSVASDLLRRHTAEKIDYTTINFFQLAVEFPALGLALNVQNHSALIMLEKTLGECRKPKDLTISITHPVEHILTSFSHNVFESLKSITIHDGHQRKKARQVNSDFIQLEIDEKFEPRQSPLRFLHSETSNDLEIVIEAQLQSECFVSVLNICAARKRSVSVDLTRHGDLLCGRFPLLHRLILNVDDIYNENNLKTIARANAEGKLPNLSIQDRSGSSVEGCLYLLLTGIFPSLTTLILSNCGLKAEDLTSLAEASEQGRLPELRHLDISWNKSNNILDYNILDVSLLAAIPKLTTLVARGCRLNDLRGLSEASGAGKLQHLTALDLSGNIIGISDLLSQPFLSLKILILRHCHLESDCMRSLARANAQNRLPELKLLDISLNDLNPPSRLSELLSHQFLSLTYLILCECFLKNEDLDILAQAKLAGILPAVRYIDVSFNNLTGQLGRLTRDRRTGREVFWGKTVCFDKFLDGSGIWD